MGRFPPLRVSRSTIPLKGIIVSAVISILVAALGPPAGAQTLDLDKSYFVPQAGPVATPVEGTAATKLFRACPNNDGGASLPNNVRVKVVLHDSNGNGISGISATDICLLFNGGTSAQGFSGPGADSVVANGTFNQAPLCPNLQCVQADAPTDATGTTYITFTGATAGSPGVGTRDPGRKWGHYDSDIPVTALGLKLQGRLHSSDLANDPNLKLQIKNFDHTGGLGTALNQGEAVTSADFNAVVTNIGVNNALTWWRDFDSDCGTNSNDFNMISNHVTHDCDTPNNP